MRSFAVVQGRLEKLIKRYRKRYVQKHTDRLPGNCRYNYLHSDHTLRLNHDVEHPIAPRISSTLVVIQPPKPVRLCTYGSNKSSDWSGTICDSEDVSKPCDYFRSTHPISHYENEFDARMMDDEYVLMNYPDVASLQWVLGVRKSPRSFRAYLSDIWNYLRSFYAYGEDTDFRSLPRSKVSESTINGGSAVNTGDATGSGEHE